jgi:hypothetical protein
VDLQQHPLGNKRPISKWLDEDGFYNRMYYLTVTFCCWLDMEGFLPKIRPNMIPSKFYLGIPIPLAFLSGGRHYELSFDEVDVTKRYVGHLEDDFLVTLLFQED